MAYYCSSPYTYQYCPADRPIIAKRHTFSRLLCTSQKRTMTRLTNVRLNMQQEMYIQPSQPQVQVPYGWVLTPTVASHFPGTIFVWEGRRSPRGHHRRQNWPLYGKYVLLLTGPQRGQYGWIMGFQGSSFLLVQLEAGPLVRRQAHNLQVCTEPEW